MKRLLRDTPPSYILIGELLVIFMLIPIIIAFNPLHYLSVVLVLLALLYVMWLTRFSFRLESKGTKAEGLIRKHIIRICLKFITFALCLLVIMALLMPGKLFLVIGQSLVFWFAITCVYVFLSVLPQEWLYRVFFLWRYGVLFNSLLSKVNQTVFILFNATLFCLAHIMFFNLWVLVLTFFGGLLFAYTYVKTKSYRLIVLEHSLYGLWLFTVGLGEILAFPVHSP
ncbi:CPBP family intramembrane glutamic endopeptidase [Alteromonas sp. W364]|uniref:CPBP family intramembrane glutamic endopeptidase n=1 Tax=Alteromonas sp. W364 TaxID=3075610 RepID=UPI00288737FD|nr:CPBP family intramembrane glutamic endopeptidase [Alteromonas sp. W364]MDT0627197.1 CPBP family intramembrane glutamic endopeptidase [Alteromonas sp. W364]